MILTTQVQPDLENMEITTRRSLALIELLYLADSGHSMQVWHVQSSLLALIERDLAAVDSFLQVAELLAFLPQFCPGLLVLGLLQINPLITLLRRELLGKLFKVILILNLVLVLVLILILL